MSFIKYLLVDCIVGTEMGGDGLVGCTVAGWASVVGAISGVDVKST